jgi:hypothetical protein
VIDAKEQSIGQNEFLIYWHDSQSLRVLPCDKLLNANTYQVEFPNVSRSEYIYLF